MMRCARMVWVIVYLVPLVGAVTRIEGCWIGRRIALYATVSLTLYYTRLDAPLKAGAVTQTCQCAL